eukprot:CAMPEP_0197945588 /NCGR_PEP_ID=MMETSP1439-20131203/125985_1 /TAXON_ID=66791 /ORGANISM="Gonyaulax spinifera, Strain CCMP409" /LENGTH=301 /DNA_ID=CAMNT_0043568843 /DNA_START=54 /DNA_END=960 /DNA_ORIENTATION=+
MAMRTPCSGVVALYILALLGTGFLASSLDSSDEMGALVAEDACLQDADGERCDLSLRQLRGERKTVPVSPHNASDADDAADAEKAEDAAESAPLTGPFCCQNGQGLGYTDADDIGGSCYPSSKPQVGSYCDSKDTCGSDCNGTWVLGFCGYNTSAGSADVCDTAREGNKSLRAAQGSFCGTEANVRAAAMAPGATPFCCQNGQGLGYTDADDIGGSCYPSSKPQVGSYCDSKDTCGSDCNGTWVLGFCGYNTSAGSADVCDTAREGNKSLRAAQGSFCGTEATCASSCNGTWCHFVKEYVG